MVNLSHEITAGNPDLDCGGNLLAALGLDLSDGDRFNMLNRNNYDLDLSSFVILVATLDGFALSTGSFGGGSSLPILARGLCDANLAWIDRRWRCDLGSSGRGGSLGCSDGSLVPA